MTGVGGRVPGQVLTGGIIVATEEEEVWVNKGAWKRIQKALVSTRVQGSSSQATQTRKIPEVGCKQKEKNNSGVGQLDIS